MDGTSQASEPHATSPAVSVELRHGETHISFDPDRPPRVFFDTNVILGLGNKGEAALRRLKAERGYRFRLSMSNFVELASHLADAPSNKTRDPFTKYRAAFRRVASLFDGVLPSAESELMHGVGLKESTGTRWIVDGASIEHQVKIIAQAASLEEALRVGIDPAHYKKLRAVDAKSFLGAVAVARKTITDPVKDVQAGGLLLRRFFGFLIFRASSRAIRLEKLPEDQKLAVVPHEAVPLSSQGLTLAPMLEILR